MTQSPSFFIERARRRLVRQRRINRLVMVLPLTVAWGMVGSVAAAAFLIPQAVILPALLILSVIGIFSIWRARNMIKQEEVAGLLDEKMQGQERFLTLVSLSPREGEEEFFSLVQRQARGKAATFALEKLLPFTLDRRALLVALLSLCMMLAAVWFSPVFFQDRAASKPDASDTDSVENQLEQLRQVARSLIDKQGATKEEQTAGAQLLVLAEELRNPTLSPQEKRRLVEETQKRIKLDIPLPQILPFDLKILASESKNDQGEGSESDQPQSGDKPLAKQDQPSEQMKTSSSSAGGNEQGKEAENEKTEGEENKGQSKPNQAGGSLKTNLPQSQLGEKKEQKGNESSGEQKPGRGDQQSQQAKGPSPGTDPDQPGGQQGNKPDPTKPGPLPQSQLGQKEQGAGTTSGGRGERFLKPGEQPGGFLTKDARFVKVRIPVGAEQRGNGGGELTENRSPAQAKTPYSNAPLREAPPEQAQLKQPIPLEYRNILQK